LKGCIEYINILKRCKNFEGTQNQLIVGISSNDFSFRKKSRFPIYNENQRKKILESLRFVDNALIEDSFEKKKNIF
tara:strand:+ start:2170 stop:2397 length:228 start_codon:yes stop_codon:yes gene_type:complete